MNSVVSIVNFVFILLSFISGLSGSKSLPDLYRSQANKKDAKGLNN